MDINDLFKVTQAGLNNEEPEMKFELEEIEYLEQPEDFLPELSPFDYIDFTDESGDIEKHEREMDAVVDLLIKQNHFIATLENKVKYLEGRVQELTLFKERFKEFPDALSDKPLNVSTPGYGEIMGQSEWSVEANKKGGWSVRCDAKE